MPSTEVLDTLGRLRSQENKHLRNLTILVWVSVALLLTFAVISFVQISIYDDHKAEAGVSAVFKTMMVTGTVLGVVTLLFLIGFGYYLSPLSKLRNLRKAQNAYLSS